MQIDAIMVAAIPVTKQMNTPAMLQLNGRPWRRNVYALSESHLANSGNRQNAPPNL